jgi:hypothetical protein
MTRGSATYDTALPFAAAPATLPAMTDTTIVECHRDQSDVPY